MSTIDIWLAIGLMTIATFLTRCLLFLFADLLRLPPKMQHALRYAPAAAMAAIVVPDLLLMDGTISLHWNNPKLLAGIGSLLFFLATRHLLGTIIIGMLFFTAFRLYL